MGTTSRLHFQQSTVNLQDHLILGRQIADANGNIGITIYTYFISRWLSCKESICQCRRVRRQEIPGSGRSRGVGQQPTPVSLPGKLYGQRNLVGYSPWGHKEQHTHIL